MDVLTRHCVEVYLTGRRHGCGAVAALMCRDRVIHRPEFRFASRSLKVADIGLLRLSSSKLRRPICSASSSSSAEVDLETCENLAEEIVPSKTVQVRFLLKKECLYGEQFLLVGDHPLLGSWDPSNAIPMNWSEGNVWILDKDIPIGKKIQFKFILRDDSTENESIEWQPDPDRTIEIWETNNAITICEDWEYASHQKIIEAETFIDSIEEEVTNDGADTLVEEENLIPDPVAYTAIGSALDKASMEPPSFPDVRLTNPNLAIVADNISDHIDKHQLETDFQTRQNIVEDNLVSSEGPVLVPGLSQFPMALTEEEGQFLFKEEEEEEKEKEVQVEEESSTVDELENIAVGPKEVELADATRNGAGPVLMVDYEEKQINGRTQILDTEEVSSKEVKHHAAAEVNGVLNNDIEWGRKTLLGFLSNLGLLIQ